MDKSRAKVFQTPNPLRKALGGLHGIGRRLAIEQADQNMVELHEDLTQSLTKEIAKITALVSATDEHLSDDALKLGIDIAAVIFNLAGVLGYSQVQAITVSLHDLLVVMSDKGLRCIEPVIVHGLAAQFAAPGMPELSETDAETLREHLNTILAKFRKARSSSARCAACSNQKCKNRILRTKMRKRKAQSRTR